MRLRAKDLARGGGVSVQQVRNYVAQGVLPPVERLPSGYRVFTEAHAAALTATRALAAGHGWQPTRVIMNAVHAGDLPTALAAVDESHAALDRERAEIADVLAAFETLANQDVETTTRATLRIGEVARVVGVRTSALRVWERGGLLRPARQRGTGYRVYDPTELRNARVVALLRRGAYPCPPSGRCSTSCVPPAARNGSARSSPSANATCTGAAARGSRAAPRSTRT